MADPNETNTDTDDSEAVDNWENEGGAASQEVERGED